MTIMENEPRSADGKVLHMTFLNKVIKQIKATVHLVFVGRKLLEKVIFQNQNIHSFVTLV